MTIAWSRHFHQQYRDDLILILIYIDLYFTHLCGTEKKNSHHLVAPREASPSSDTILKFQFFFVEPHQEVPLRNMFQDWTKDVKDSINIKDDLLYGLNAAGWKEIYGLFKKGSRHAKQLIQIKKSAASKTIVMAI